MQNIKPLTIPVQEMFAAQYTSPDVYVSVTRCYISAAVSFFGSRLSLELGQELRSLLSNSSFDPVIHFRPCGVGLS